MKGTSHVGHRIERRRLGRTEQLISCTELIEHQGLLVEGPVPSAVHGRPCGVIGSGGARR